MMFNELTNRIHVLTRYPLTPTHQVGVILICKFIIVGFHGFMSILTNFYFFWAEPNDFIILGYVWIEGIGGILRDKEGEDLEG